VAVNVVMSDDSGETEVKNGGGNLNNNIRLVVHQPREDPIRKKACISTSQLNPSNNSAKQTKCHDCTNSIGKVHDVAVRNSFNRSPHVDVDCQGVE